jgi:hypothetical protein
MSERGATPFAGQRPARPGRRLCGDAVADRVNQRRRNPGVVVRRGDGVGHADQPHKRRRGVVVVGALRVVGQQIGEVLGADHRHASRGGSADRGMAFPSDAGMDMDEIGGGACEPASQCGVIIVDRLDGKAVRRGAVEQSAARSSGDGDLDIGHAGRELADPGGRDAVGQQAEPCHSAAFAATAARAKSFRYVAKACPTT